MIMSKITLTDTQADSYVKRMLVGEIEYILESGPDWMITDYRNTEADHTFDTASQKRIIRALEKLIQQFRA